MREQLLYLCGKWRPGEAGKFKPVIDPATEQESHVLLVRDHRTWNRHSPLPSRAPRSGAILRRKNADECSGWLQIFCGPRSTLHRPSSLRNRAKTVSSGTRRVLRAVDTLYLERQSGHSPERAGSRRRRYAVARAGAGRSSGGICAVEFPRCNYRAQTGPGSRSGLSVILKAPEEAPGAAARLSLVWPKQAYRPVC